MVDVTVVAELSEIIGTIGLLTWLGSLDADATAVFGLFTGPVVVAAVAGAATAASVWDEAGGFFSPNISAPFVSLIDDHGRRHIGVHIQL